MNSSEYEEYEIPEYEEFWNPYQMHASPHVTNI